MVLGGRRLWLKKGLTIQMLSPWKIAIRLQVVSRSNVAVRDPFELIQVPLAAQYVLASIEQTLDKKVEGSTVSTI